MIDDFRDVLREFVAHQVIFLVVGAHALAVHGIPRATGDLDVLVQANPGNAARVLAALASWQRSRPLVLRSLTLASRSTTSYGLMSSLSWDFLRIGSTSLHRSAA